MTTVHTSTVLRWLATLDCALEDYQAFAEQGAVSEMETSRDHMKTAVSSIRDSLDRLEQAVGL